MPESSQLGNGEISSAEATQVEESGNTSTQGASPTPQQEQISAAEYKAMKAQFDRMKEDLDRANETSRILQGYVQQNQQQKAKPDDDEYADVDKTLGPWLDRRLKPYVDNMSKVLTEHYDQIDELRFMRDLIHADPEFAERLNPGIPVDEIDRYRMRIAQTEGRYIRRSDALGLLRGMKAITEEKKSKLSKKQRAEVDESVRQAAVEATQSGEGKPELKTTAGPGGKAQEALKKLRAGQHLTDEERALAREALANVEI